MRNWIFQCNPKRYRIDRRLAEAEAQICWLVTRYKDQIAPGDRAYIWQAGPNRGVCAIMSIESSPADLDETETDARYWVDPLNRRRACRVQGTLTDWFPVVGVDEIRAVPGLRNLSILGAPQGTNFRVSDQEAHLLDKLLHRLGRISSAP